ncbi:hypothetical protein FB451DRAFT_28789 [Mycena latifolia]|nr:hypothetical protein FB451DRAFT_28789 [Mycena latifolia]
MAKNKNGKQKQRLEEVPEEEDEEYYDYSAEEEEDYGLGDLLGESENNWAAAATAGQYDPWGNKTVHQAASGSQWGSAIPTPAQLAAHHTAVAASGGRGGGGGGGAGKKGENAKGKGGDKAGKGGGKSAASAWEAQTTRAAGDLPPTRNVGKPRSQRNKPRVTGPAGVKRLKGYPSFASFAQPSEPGPRCSIGLSGAAQRRVVLFRPV